MGGRPKACAFGTGQRGWGGQAQLDHRGWGMARAKRRGLARGAMIEQGLSRRNQRDAPKMSEANRRGHSSEARTRRARKRVRGEDPRASPTLAKIKTLAYEQRCGLDEVQNTM